MNNKKNVPFGLRTIMELFDVGPIVAISVLASTAAILIFAIYYFIHSAPPTTLTISAGPEGSAFQKNAVKYAKILERNGVKLKILTSKGSQENLQRLLDPKAHTDIGIVQGGITNLDVSSLSTLGSIAYQPIMIFYRHSEHLELLSQFANKKIAIGPVGSGVRNFALKLLEANGIKEDGKTIFLDWDAEEASKALLEQKIDIAFIMSESASTSILHNLLRAKEVKLFHFKQANAYSRKIEFLNVLDLPEGAIDLGLNIPPHEITLIGPMIELVVTKNMHPALIDLVLEAATEVHSRPGIFQHRGEFPAPIEHAIHLNDDASRFYKSGKSFLYRILPFWLASLISRIIVVFIPVLVVLVPALKSIPALFRWSVQTKIRRRYRELLDMEKEFLEETDPAKRAELKQHFDHIEAVVNKMNVRAAFAEQFYGLRGHIDYVRQLIAKKA